MYGQIIKYTPSTSSVLMIFMKYMCVCAKLDEYWFGTGDIDVETVKTTFMELAILDNL